MNPVPTKVIFFQVKDNSAKIRCICAQVKESMEKEKKILIQVPNEEAGHYLDALLWRLPEDSFIPHIQTNVNKQIKEWVVITELETNLNEASFSLNLKPSISLICHQFEEVYEFYEAFNEQKVQAAEKKMADYREKNINVIMKTFS
jgi:DNA polymerase-3 subunit chi